MTTDALRDRAKGESGCVAESKKITLSIIE
jgi:hypothetical protein